MITIVVLAVGALAYLSYATSWFNFAQYWSSVKTSVSIVRSKLPENPFVPKLEPLEPISQPAYKWLDRGRWVYGDTPPFGVDAIRIDKQKPATGTQK